MNNKKNIKHVENKIDSKQARFNCLNLKKYKWTNWIQFVCVIIAMATFGMICAGVVIDIVSSQPVADIVWWNCLQFFTQQSNLLVVILVLALWIAPKTKFFGNQTLIVFITSYITITLLIFNIILLPAKLNDGGFDSFGWAHNAFVHIINPLSCILFFFVWTSTNRNKIGKGYKCVPHGMVYPTIYISYAAILPFVSNHSVYDTFTNMNSKLPISVNGVDVYGSINNIVYFVAIWLAFIAVIALYWLFSFIMNKKSIQVNSSKSK